MRSRCVVRAAAFAGCLGGLFVPSSEVSAQNVFTVSVLVRVGDAVAGVGAVTTIDNVAVGGGGAWIVQCDTDHADTNRDNVLLRNGAVLVREGDSLANPPGAEISSFDSVNVNSSGNSGWNFFLRGLPANQDSGVFYGTQLLIQESNVSTAPEFSPGTPYLGFFDAKMNDANVMSLVASVDDPAIPTTVDRAIVRLQLDASGDLRWEQVVAKEGDVLPGQVETVADFSTGPHSSAISSTGQILYIADLTGPTATDGALYLERTLIAQEGQASPISGRAYEFLLGRGVDANSHGDVLFKANLDGATTDDDAIFRNRSVVAREGSGLAPIGAFTFTGFGLSGGPVQIDDHRNVLWFAEWNNPDTTRNAGLFLNNVLLVQKGVTKAGDLTIDLIQTGEDSFAMSDNGRFVIFEGRLQGGMSAAMLLQINPSPPVPDGRVVPGTPHRAGKSGTAIEVTWDVTSCPADAYNLFYGDLAAVSTYTYTGAVCGIGTSGAATFTPPDGNVFWVIASESQRNQARIEGTHGYDSRGRSREARADALCPLAGQIHGSSCP